MHIRRRKCGGWTSFAASSAAVLGALLLLHWPVPAARAAADEPIRIELNTVEAADNRCRASFVLENKGNAGVESLKLDLAVFDIDGGIRRRLVVDMGPLRPSKTSVKTFLLDDECAQIGSILVNDVTACSPGDPGSCLDRLTLSSRVTKIRFYK